MKIQIPKKFTRHYPELWYKVDYKIIDTYIEFTAYEIHSLNEDKVSESEISIEPNIKGVLKWDGCINFNQDSHYCSIYQAEQTLGLFKEIYKLLKFIQ